jgi:hypothetical protein
MEEPEQVMSELTTWVVSDKEIIYMGEWRPNQRKWYPFNEINSFKREWAFFRLQESEPLYSPRELPDKTERRLRVIPDIFLFVAGPQLTERFLGRLKNSKFKLTELFALKSAMDRAISKSPVPEFDESNPIPRFTPDLTNVMTGKLRGFLEEFSQYIKAYIKPQ